MDKKQGPITNFKNWILKNQPENKAGKYRYLIIVLCLGAAFMLASNLLNKKQTQAPDQPVSKVTQTSGQDVPAFGLSKNSGNKDITDYEQQYESELKTSLDEMLGVKDTRVVVNVDSTEEKVLEKNTNTKNQTTNETDRDGGKRKVEDSSTDEQMVIIRNGDQDSPVVVQTKKPKIRGVLVVAKGAENIEVKKWIVDAVTRVLDVPSYRVAVMPKK